MAKLGNKWSSVRSQLIQVEDHARKYILICYYVMLCVFVDMTRVVFIFSVLCFLFKLQRFFLSSSFLSLPFLYIFSNSSLSPLSLALFYLGQGPSLLRNHENTGTCVFVTPKTTCNIDLAFWIFHAFTRSCFRYKQYALEGYTFSFASFILRILLPLMRIIPAVPSLMRRISLFYVLEPAGWCPLLFGWKSLKV